LYVLADLSTVWVQAKVYEYELPHVELGQPATVTLAALPEQKLTGKVVFVQPTVEETTRTVQVRVELPNDKGLLKPGMFANVEIQHTMGEGLLVPTSAVIRTGERDIVYRMGPQGKFEPIEVKISSFKFGDRFQILEGLKAGDKVVTSANFLIDSESRLRIGGGMMPGMDMGEMKGKDQKGDMKMDHKKSMEGMDHGKMKNGDRKSMTNEG
jgi:Cu(I)/Ag(I) efflux system membrane fusion protein